MASTDAAESPRMAMSPGFEARQPEDARAFDELVQLAAQICQTPMAVISLVDGNEQRLRSKIGLEASLTADGASFWTHALQQDEILLVTDATQDSRFADNDMVTGKPWIRFCAAVPLRAQDGEPLGTLCVLDRVPRELSALQLDQLGALARQVMAQLTLRRQAIELAAEVAARVASESALGASQQLLAGILDNSQAAIYATTPDGHFILANSALSSILGVPEDAILGRLAADLAAPARLLTSQASLNAGVDRRVFAEELPHADGTTHHYLSTKFGLRNGDGAVYALAGVSTDVSDLVEQRRSHAESEQRWRSLVENSPAGVTVIGIDAKFRYANPQAQALYGGTLICDLVGRPATDFVPRTGEDFWSDLWNRLEHGEAVRAVRRPLRQLDGNLIEVELNAGPVEYEGQPAIQLELRDMSAIATAEAALRESEARWRQLIADSPVGVGVADERGVFVNVNPALCAMFGLAEADLLGKNTADFSHPDELDAHQEMDSLITSASDGVVTMERRYLRPDGKQGWLWLTVTHTPGPSGRTWSIAYGQDVTERKLGEQAVLDSEANLSAVSRVVKRIQSGADARQTIVQAAVELADAKYVMFLEPTADGLALRVSACSTTDFDGMEIPLSLATPSVEVFRDGDAVFIADPPAVSDNPIVKISRVRSAYFVPVRSGEALTAVLSVGWDHRIASLDDRRASVITLLADQAGVALRQSALLAELESLALTDSLTSLPNRRDWDRRIAMLIQMAARNQSPLTIAIADLDHFKRFNDSHGHLAGDLLLRDFAGAAQRSLRSGDTLARWGGEEFALALPDCSGDEAGAVLDRVRRAVPMGVTCSIGHAIWDGFETPDELMARADKALYCAKTSGRDQIQRAS